MATAFILPLQLPSRSALTADVPLPFRHIKTLQNIQSPCRTPRMTKAPTPSPTTIRDLKSKENGPTVNVVDIYDTTLRDGAQGEGISLSVQDKVAITERLGRFGVGYVEGGWPGSNPKDVEFFSQWRSGRVHLGRAKLVAFGATRRKGVRCEEDPQVATLLQAGTPVVTLVGKSWSLQVEQVLETTLEENLSMIGQTVAYMKAHGREVMLDAEHFFDGFKADRQYALASLRAAVDAGADVVVLCDTNGGSAPWEIATVVGEVKSRFPKTRIGIHCHNDMELAVANSISAVRAGATLVQGTINGYGERTGNANLTSILPTLQLKMGYHCVGDSITQLTSVSRFVDEIANQMHVASRPFVGDSAFAHKGGLHVAAVMKNAGTYQHIDPAAVGNIRRVLVSELSGRGNILEKAKELGLYDDDNAVLPGEEERAWKARARKVLERVKRLENKGYTFEGAEASVELMIRRSMPNYRCPFDLIDFTVITGSRKSEYDADERVSQELTQATVKLALLGGSAGGDVCPVKICLEVGEGNGPVDAVNQALNKALIQAYGRLVDVTLIDYKVRILDNESATKAITRVMVQFMDNQTQQTWTTVHVHRNIIVASVGALMDGFEYAMTRFLPECVSP